MGGVKLRPLRTLLRQRPDQFDMADSKLVVHFTLQLFLLNNVNQMNGPFCSNCVENSPLSTHAADNLKYLMIVIL